MGIIALLNLQYWCEDENEKQRLKAIYAENERKYQEELREKYNPDNLFKNKQKAVEEKIEETAIVEYKEPVFKRLINKILNFLHLR